MMVIYTSDIMERKTKALFKFPLNISNPRNAKIYAHKIANMNQFEFPMDSHARSDNRNSDIETGLSIIKLSAKKRKTAKSKCSNVLKIRFRGNDLM